LKAKKHKDATMEKATIACLGWGSLIWDNSRPFETKGNWQNDGPALPIEFARQSKDDRITLVIADSEHAVPTLWAELDVATLDDAISKLAIREGCQQGSIGRWPNNLEGRFPCQDKICSWAHTKKLTAVVWTALCPGMKGNRCKTPTLAQVQNHLADLDKDSQAGAIEYIHRAPKQIATPYRSSLENCFPLGDMVKNSAG
jgi:hypothetical protein